MFNRKIRVLVVDDSAIVRQTMKEVLESDTEIEVIATAADPYIAASHMMRQAPDVITLDVEMPRMDGLTFLDRIMRQHPLPVVMCSSLTTAGSETAISALEKGAVDIITKPAVGTRQFLEESRVRICDAVKAAAHARLIKPRVEAASPSPAPKLTADVMMPKPDSHAMIQTTERIVAIGASTGGTEALKDLLQALPANAPGIIIVQHMPEKFTAAFAQRLNTLCQITVKEAADNDSVLRGQALIAPGNKHMMLKRSGARYCVEIRDGPLVCRHRPSVDVLFRSAARYGGKNVVGVILTGMGDDGSRGMREMKDAGAYNIAQDEASCVVFGMPQEAIKIGAVDQVLPLSRIAGEITRLCR
jgi:two-component system chemotaxis response regulator CheB